MAGFASDEEIDLFKEVMFDPSVECPRLDKESSFQLSKIGDGDIICYQKSSLTSNVHSFLDEVNNNLSVQFRSLKMPEKDEFKLRLSMKDSYHEVVESVAKHLGLGTSTNIWLTSHNCLTEKPMPVPVRDTWYSLSDMLLNFYQDSHILYYEIVSTRLPEDDAPRELKVFFRRAMGAKETLHITLPEEKHTVNHVIDILQQKVHMSKPNAKLILFKANHHTISKIFDPDGKIEDINEKIASLHAEEISEEELCPGKRLIRVHHFCVENKQVVYIWEPSLLVFQEGETLAELEVRLWMKLQVQDDEVSKWRFAILSLYKRRRYIKDSDVISHYVQGKGVYATEECLGVEHNDTVL